MASIVARAGLAALVLTSCTKAPPPDEPDAPAACQAPTSVAVAPTAAPSAAPAVAPRERPGEPVKGSEFCPEGPPKVPVPDTRVYATWQKFPLHAAENGVDGTLRVLQDSRYTTIERHGTHPSLPPCDGLPGRIEILDRTGAILEATEAARQTDVTPYPFAPGQTVYEQRSLVQCLASCWCGDHVKYMRVVGAHFVPLESLRPSGKVEPVHGVTRGCYEDGSIAHGANGALEIHIHRSVRATGSHVAADERHFWDGAVWRSTVREVRQPW